MTVYIYSVHTYFVQNIINNDEFMSFTIVCFSPL